jgi:hypothetical protein
MKQDPPSAIQFSNHAYRQLLRVYPKRHRAEYGECMAQLFRDQCRDAWAQSHWQGLFLLWLRTWPDFLKTVFIEHLSQLKENNIMFKNASRNPCLAFILTAITVFFAGLQFHRHRLPVADPGKIRQLHAG